MRQFEINKMKKTEIKRMIYKSKIGDKIACCDYSEYDETRCHNGGCYWYENRYSYLGRGKWLLSPYCTGDGDIFTPAENQIVTTKHVVRDVLNTYMFKTLSAGDYDIYVTRDF